jgi:hypothetical protein
MPRLLLNIIAAGTDELVSGNKFLCAPVSKKFVTRKRGHVLTPSVRPFWREDG